MIMKYLSIAVVINRHAKIRVILLFKQYWLRSKTSLQINNFLSLCNHWLSTKLDTQIDFQSFPTVLPVFTTEFCYCDLFVCHLSDHPFGNTVGSITINFGRFSLRFLLDAHISIKSLIGSTAWIKPCFAILKWYKRPSRRRQSVMASWAFSLMSSHFCPWRYLSTRTSCLFSFPRLINGSVSVRRNVKKHKSLAASFWANSRESRGPEADDVPH